jgi:hypothetical protein
MSTVVGPIQSTLTSPPVLFAFCGFGTTKYLSDVVKFELGEKWNSFHDDEDDDDADVTRQSAIKAVEVATMPSARRGCGAVVLP